MEEFITSRPWLHTIVIVVSMIGLVTYVSAAVFVAMENMKNRKQE